MTAANHAATGALIVALAPTPFVGLPLALLSHFALDMLPHFDEAGFAEKITLSQHHAVLALDGLIAIAAVILAIKLSPAGAILIILGAFLAMLPDIMWLPYYLNDTIGNVAAYGPLATVHKRVQSREEFWGIWVEIFWFIAVILFFYRYAR